MNSIHRYPLRRRPDGRLYRARRANWEGGHGKGAAASRGRQSSGGEREVTSRHAPSLRTSPLVCRRLSFGGCESARGFKAPATNRHHVTNGRRARSYDEQAMHWAIRPNLVRRVGPTRAKEPPYHLNTPGIHDPANCRYPSGYALSCSHRVACGPLQQRQVGIGHALLQRPAHTRRG